MSENDKLTDKEIDARREAGLKKLLATPHKPHKPKTDAAPQRSKGMRVAKEAPASKRSS